MLSKIYRKEATLVFHGRVHGVQTSLLWKPIAAAMAFSMTVVEGWCGPPWKSMSLIFSDHPHDSTHLMVTWEVPELYPLPEHDRLIPPMVAETPALIDWPQYSWTQSWFISSWGWRKLQQSFLIFRELGLGCLSKKQFNIILKDPQISLNVLLFIHLIVFICFFLVFFSAWIGSILEYAASRKPCTRLEDRR